MSPRRALAERTDVLPALAEVFREHGFEGASLSLITKATGLGKGSLYNFFPAGKTEMMTAVLAAIDDWFNTAIFRPLEQAGDAASAISRMMEDVDTYFRSGGRVCLVGSLGLSVARDPFAESVRAYFAHWISALAACLEKGRVPEEEAAVLAEETVAGIQGAIVLARALDDNEAFRRIIHKHELRLSEAIAAQHATQH